MSGHDAEDLYQELVMALKDKLTHYTPQPTRAGGFCSWLAVVIRHKVHDFRRRRTNRGGSEPVHDDLTDGTAESFTTTVAEELDREFLARTIDQIIDAGFPNQRWYSHAWRALWVDEQSPEEIAVRLGRKYDAVTKALGRVRKYLAAAPEVIQLLFPHREAPE